MPTDSVCVWIPRPSQNEKYESLRARPNQALLFSGMAVKESGELVEVDKVSTIGDAQRRSNELKAALLKRDIHPDVLAFCTAELLAENFFHAVTAATKSVAAKLRSKSDLTGDGSADVDAALSGDSPKLIVNGFTSDSEKSEQQGLATLSKGVFCMFRNPAANEASIHWPMSVEDAADLISTVSLIHRRLDRAVLLQG